VYAPGGSVVALHTGQSVTTTNGNFSFALPLAFVWPCRTT